MSEESVKNITVRVQRYDPENGGGPNFQEFVVPASRGVTVLDGLIYIKENLDSTLAFRSSCRMSVCGSCAVIVNGFPHLACHTQINEFDSDIITVQPLANMPIVKDLVCSLDSMFDNHRSIKPYFIHHDKEEIENPTAAFTQSPEEVLEFSQFTNCVKCGICVSACPTSASDKLFLGPQALAQCYRYCGDSRDEGAQERHRVVDAEQGVWHCHLAGACSEACPKGLDPGLAIQLLKRQMTARALNLGRKRQSALLVPPPTETKPKIAVPEFTAEGKTSGKTPEK